MYAHSEEQLQYLATVEKGWLDGDDAGEPVSDNIMKRTREVLETFQSQNILEPILFPMEEGTIIIEWHLDNGITTIDVEPETYYLFNLNTEAEPRYTHKEDVTELREVVAFAMEKVGTA